MLTNSAPDPRLHSSLQNVARIPRDRPCTEAELRSIFGGDIEGGLSEIYGVRLATHQQPHPTPEQEAKERAPILA